MEKDENSDSSLSEEEIENSDIDSDRPNLLQINKKIDKMNREKNLSLLEKKRKRNKNYTDIIYDSNKKTIEDSFVPNVEELNDFLKNCKIEEIKFEELEKIPKEKIFDPDLFIEENYKNKEIKKDELKHTFSLEELGFELDNNSKESIKEEDLNPSSMYEDKYEDKLNLKKILQEKDIKIQKKEIHELIEKIKIMNIEDIKKSMEGKANTKINIVFDLDNTCIFAKFIYPKDIQDIGQKYPKKDFKIIKFQHQGNFMITAFIIRKGLKDIFDFTKSFSNFYISTLGVKNYGLKIKDILSDKFGINFLGYKVRNYEKEETKFLSDLNLDTQNTIIFDDRPGVWIKDKQNVIISKHFTDREINIENLKRLNLQNNTNSFLNDYKPFSYYSSEGNWQNQKLKEKVLSPFYDFEKKNCFSGEYLESSKYQFIYMKEIIKIIYYLIYNSNIGVPEALKLIRYNIFFNSYFDLDYYYNKEGYEILKDIIINCGGEIYNPKEKNKDKDMKFFFVCSSDDYILHKDEINKEKKFLHKNAKVISDKYIINSFYFMSNLENELGNPNYCLDLNGEENYDNY